MRSRRRIGRFLIRAFEHVRDRIAQEIQDEKDRTRAEIEAERLGPEEEEARIDAAFAALNRELLPSDDRNRPVDTRVGRLAWRCIFGCDAEPRAARTAKMNMIMHGDGHGGIHHHDGLVDINGIFPSRFDVIVTNPPFGSNVGSDQKVGGSDETRVPDDDAYRADCLERYGSAWERSWRRMRAAAGTNILDLFEIGRGKRNRATEIVFVERCLSLLRPGGRMGIVLPDGNLNNPSLAWLRRWCEGKARILAVVSLPEQTFRSADATVKASLVFLRRFTEAEEAEWEAAWEMAHADHDDAFDARRDELCAAFGRRVVTGENAAVAMVLDELAGLGVERTEPDWSPGAQPAYPRGVGPTGVVRPRWRGTAMDSKRAARLKRDYAAAFDKTADARARALLGELRAGLRRVDEAHNAALWEAVRETFDYPVFVAAPRAVGITSTGETGEDVPDELPAVLDAFRAFEVWVEAGAKVEDAPDSPALRCLIRRWRELEPWIVAEDTEHRRSRFPLTPLRELTIQRREAVRVKESLGDWTPITVHLTGEISARDRTRPYKGGMFAAYPGDIVFSKIDARSGAIGMMPPETGKAVVTTEFPVFTADPARLEGEFAKLVLRTGGFIEALRRKASGTSGRKRITPDAFQDMRIPLPPLDRQRAIVAAHRAALDRAAALEREAGETEARAREAFEAALGFAPPAPLPDRPVFVASFKDLDRWSHEAVLHRAVEGGTARTSPWPTVQLRDVIGDLVVGWSPKCLNRPVGHGEWGILKLSAATSGRLKPSENKALPPKIKPRPELEVKRGDVLITRGSGLIRLVGATTFVADEPPRRMMICDLIFRVIFEKAHKIDPAFLAEVLSTTDLRRQIEERRTGSAPMMQKVTKSVLMSLRIPLPPKTKQVAVTAALTNAHTAAISLREKAGKVRAKAWVDFEAAVYAAENNPSMRFSD